MSAFGFSEPLEVFETGVIRLERLDDSGEFGLCLVLNGRVVDGDVMCADHSWEWWCTVGVDYQRLAWLHLGVISHWDLYEFDPEFATRLRNGKVDVKGAKAWFDTWK